MTTARQLLHDLEKIVATINLDELPAIAGTLEQVRVKAFIRLLVDRPGVKVNHSSAAQPAELLTAQEVAGLLKISKWGVYDLVSRHRLPAIRLGHALRIRRVDVEAYVAERTHGP